MKTVVAADLFCGAGGSSTGLRKFCEARGWNMDLTAVNHWDIAVETHAANHPEADHFCEDLDNLNPRRIFRGRQLDVLTASPECTHHSNARGGKPCDDQSRSTAWHVLRWAEALCPRVILVENIREFQDWGPLVQKTGKNGKPVYNEDGTPHMLPDKSRKGEIFRAWLDALRSLGYWVTYGLVNAANYGDPTTRERLFILADRVKEPRFAGYTHAKQPGTAEMDKWIPAKDIIDWEFPSQSIFNRKRPLADKTIAKIIKGLERYGGDSAEPFLTILRGTSTTHTIDRPLSTISAGGGHHGLVELHPFMLPQHSGGAPRSVEDPVATIAAKGAISVIQPYLTGYYGGKSPRTYDVDNPLATITAGGNRFGLVEPFLVAYYGKSWTHSVDYPVPTIVTRDRFGLVQQVGLDIHFRMLQPHELAAAMSFPKEYRFCGTKTDQIRQIGNAVPVMTSSSLFRGLLVA